MLYRVSGCDRYHWNDLGESDSAEQIVFDDATGATHLVDSLARTIQSLLRDTPEGLSADGIQLAIGLSEADEADEPARQFVTELLSVMHTAGLIEVSTEGDAALRHSIPR